MRGARRWVGLTAVLVSAMCCAEAQTGAPQATPAVQPPIANVVLPAPMDAVPAKINFDVVSFKRCPDGKFGTTKVDMPLEADYLAYHCEALSRLIYFAYNGAVKVYSLERGYPQWVDSTRYEFVAKVPPEDFEAWKKLDLPGRRVLMRKVLADTVKLKIRVDQTPKSIYALTAMKNPKLKVFSAGDATKLPDGRIQSGRAADWVGWTGHFQAFTMPDLAEVLSLHLDRVVVDHTNLTDRYTFELPLIPGRETDPGATIMANGEEIPSVSDALYQLGLKLQGAKAVVERLVIDHIEPPQED
jgi:uncharacterized protein (TIGR03435 family)